MMLTPFGPSSFTTISGGGLASTRLSARKISPSNAFASAIESS